MSFLLLLAVLSQAFAAVGQVFLKKAMTWPESSSRRRGQMVFAGGIAFLTLWFFIWTGLMPRFALSYLFPFEGLHYPFVVAAAALFLKERVSWSLLAGLILICAGVALVSAS